MFRKVEAGLLPGMNRTMLTSSEGGSAPPSPREYENDLIFVTYNGRQVVLGWSPSLDEAKATACQDLGLAEHGYSGKDIALLFHPGNDPSNPLIEVLASAWPKLRPLPHFQLIVRALQEGTTESPKHYAYQRTQAGHPDGLRSQSSSLMNSGKYRRSREGEFASIPYTDASAGFGRVDIESWRRDQMKHLSQPDSSALSLDNRSTLPQHTLPSPPVSDVQSCQGTSSCHGPNNRSSPTSPHSADLDIHVHSSSTLHRTEAEGVECESDNTGFLAQSGRRTTVHFPHILPSTKPGLLAPTPIRRSHSQELLNADYTNFMRDLTQRQHSYHLQEQSTRHNAENMSGHAHRSRQSPIPYATTTSLARSYNNMASPASSLSSARQVTKRSSLRQSWDYETSRVKDVSSLGQVHSPHSLHPPGMHRSSSSSTLGMPKPRAHLNLGTGSSPTSDKHDGPGHLARSYLAPQLDLPSGMPVDLEVPRRASLPGVINPPQAHTSRATGAHAESFLKTAQFKAPSAHSALAVMPVDDLNRYEDSSDEEEVDRASMDMTVTMLHTPNRRNDNKTLRRLKSSPSGLADRYNNHYVPYEVPMSPTRDEAFDGSVTQLASSTKRQPTSWPNSPVKRNASVSTARSVSIPVNSFTTHMPFASPDTFDQVYKNGGLSASWRQATHIPLSPPPLPPLIPVSDGNADRAFSHTFLGGAIPPFLLDKRRPDSPMPPLFTRQSLPSSPEASMTKGPASTVGKQTFNPYIATDGDSIPYSDFLLTPQPVESHVSAQQRLRNRNSQSAENLFGMVSGIATGPPTCPSLPKIRSQLNLGASGKSRRP